MTLIKLTTLATIGIFIFGSCTKEMIDQVEPDTAFEVDFPEIKSINFSDPVQPGDNVTFTATLKESAQSANFIYTWEVEDQEESTHDSFSHTFLTEGAFEVKLKVENKQDEGTASSEESVTVYVNEIHEGEAYFSSKGNSSSYFVSIHVEGPNNYEEDLYIVDYDYSSQYNCDVPSYMYTNNNWAGHLGGLKDGTYTYTWDSDDPLQLPITGVFTILNESCSHIKN